MSKENGRDGEVVHLDGADISRKLVEMIRSKGRDAAIEFGEYLRGLVRKYQKATGQKPSLDLVFLADDLGSTDEEKRSWLRFLKALKEGYVAGHVVGSITVKGDPSVVDIEQNVFASGVRFEELK